MYPYLVDGKTYDKFSLVTKRSSEKLVLLLGGNRIQSATRTSREDCHSCGIEPLRTKQARQHERRREERRGYSIDLDLGRPR